MASLNQFNPISRVWMALDGVRLGCQSVDMGNLSECPVIGLDMSINRTLVQKPRRSLLPGLVVFPQVFNTLSEKIDNGIIYAAVFFTIRRR